MSKIIYILCILFPLICSSQSDQYNSKVTFAVETYAFLKGQNAALAKVAAQFPHLKPNVAAAEKNLKSAFGRAEKNIQQYLKEELNTFELNLLLNQIDSLLSQKLVHPIEKEAYAHDLLLALKERSNNLNNEMLSKGILSFKYHDAPHQEITDGHVAFFSTENHPKAEEVSLKIPIPKSWLAQEAKMPETIQQFTSYYGNGNEKILIVVYDLPKELQGITLTEKSVAELLPPQTKLLRTERLNIDNLPAFMIEVEESMEYQNDSMKVRMMQFMFLKDQKLYCLQGSIGPVKADEDMGMEIKKYEPLFRLIASKTELNN